MDINANIKNFENIKNIKFNIDNILLNIKDITKKLIEYYHDFITEYKTTIFIFGIDSLYFQNKLIENQIDSLLKLCDLILNRMYCEYYKLYKLIINYINDELKDDEIMNNINQRNKFPKYNDLDIYKKYDFILIINLQEEINNIFSIMNNILTEKKQILSNHKKKKNIGLNIDNFVSTFNFEVIKFEEQIKLFDNYLNFFYNIHYKNLNRFLTKIKLFYTQINNDINFNFNDMNKDNMIDIIMDSDGHDKNLQKSLQDSVIDSESMFDNININDFEDNNLLNMNELIEVNMMFKNDIKIE